MSQNIIKATNDILEQRVQQLTQCMVRLRQQQNKADAEYVASIGNLSVQQLTVINIIGDKHRATMSEIAENALLSLSSITSIVEKLVKSQLVDRIRSETDRRIVYAELTKAGQAIFETQLEYMNQAMRSILNKLTDTEQDNLVSLFHTFTSTD